MAQAAFGKRVKELRNQQRLTQQKLAVQVSVDVGYISKIEAGKVPPPSEKVIERLALALKISKDELMVLGGRAPKDLEPIITGDVRIPTILRRARGLSPQDWAQVERYIEQLAASKQEH